MLAVIVVCSLEHACIADVDARAIEVRPGLAVEDRAHAVCGMPARVRPIGGQGVGDIGKPGCGQLSIARRR